jgi:hypothetical protein
VISNPLRQLYAAVYLYYQQHPERTPSFLTATYLARLQPFTSDRDIRLATSTTTQNPLTEETVGSVEDRLIQDAYDWANTNNLSTFADVAPNPFQNRSPR